MSWGRREEDWGGSILHPQTEGDWTLMVFVKHSLCTQGKLGTKLYTKFVSYSSNFQLFCNRKKLLPFVITQQSAVSSIKFLYLLWVMTSLVILRIYDFGFILPKESP